jgi:hypothetical protein
MPYDPNAHYVDEKPLIKTIRISVVALSVVLFLFSCFNICFCTVSGCRGSIDALLMGWFAVAALDGSGMAWLANPFLLITLILVMRKSKYALLLSIFTILFSLSFLGVSDVFANEGGTHEKIIKIAIGYWIWFSSCAIAFIGILAINVLKNKLE